MPETVRDESGKFRKANDAPINVVLADEANKRAEKKAADDALAAGKKPDEKVKTSLEQAGEHVLDEFVGVDRKKEKADKDEAEAASKKKVEKEKRDKEKLKVKEPKPEPKSEPLGAEQIERIASAAAEGVARGLKPEKKEEKVEVKAPTPTGPEARHLEVLARLEKMWPDEYKGASKRYQDAQTRIEAYRKAWEKEHPGESFDEEADEHKEYYDKNDLFEFWDSRDYARAAGNIEAERIASEKKDDSGNDDIRKELTELKRKENLREARQTIAQEQTNVARDFWKEVGEDFADLVHENGEINREKLDELKQTNPIAFDYYTRAATNLNHEIEALYSIMHDLAKYDPQNPAHAAMGKFGEMMEQNLASKPTQERLDEKGRVFMTGKDYYALPKDKRDKYWTLTYNDIAYHRAKVLAGSMKKAIQSEEERLDQFAAARGYTKPNGNGKHEREPDPEHQEDREEQGFKPRSPSSGSESRLAHRQIGVQKAAQARDSSWADTL